MKILGKHISGKNGEGYVVLNPEDGEDLWHAYNLVCVGDDVTATAIRKVVKETANLVSSQRKRIKLTIKVLAVDFDPLDCSIRLSGRNITENPFVKLGAHHTLELEPHRKFTLSKQCWDTIFLERLDTASNPAKQASLAAVVLDQGLANVCLITGHMTIVRSRLEKSIPKKRAVAKAHEDAMKKFYEMVLQAVLREIDFEVVKTTIIASPGYVKDDFFKYIISEAEKRPELKQLKQNKGQFVLVHSSSGHKHALEQVLQDEGLQSKLADSQAAKETAVLQKFFRMLNDDSEKAFYTFSHVRAAQDKGAIQSLLVTDTLFRSSDVQTRRKYVQLVEDCRESGAKVYIFSALHPSGEQLTQLSGVAALLRYGLPDLDILQVDDEQVAAQQAEVDAFESFMPPGYDQGEDDEEDDDRQQTHEERDADELFNDMFSA